MSWDVAHGEYEFDFLAAGYRFELQVFVGVRSSTQRLWALLGGRRGFDRNAMLFATKFAS